MFCDQQCLLEGLPFVPGRCSNQSIHHRLRRRDDAEFTEFCVEQRAVRWVNVSAAETERRWREFEVPTALRMVENGKPRPSLVPETEWFESSFELFDECYRHEIEILGEIAIL